MSSTQTTIPEPCTHTLDTEERDNFYNDERLDLFFFFLLLTVKKGGE